MYVIRHKYLNLYVKFFDRELDLVNSDVEATSFNTENDAQNLINKYSKRYSALLTETEICLKS